jgi:group I intron endonuclease
MNAHASNTTPTKSIIKNAIQKYGRDKFTLQVLVMGTQAYCYELETKAIVAFNTMKPHGYNICTGGKGAIGIFGEANGMFGRKHSQETRDKIKARALGRVASEETKEKMRLTHLGKPMSLEHRENTKISKKLSWQDPAYKAKMFAAGFGNRVKKGVAP